MRKHVWVASKTHKSRLFIWRFFLTFSGSQDRSYRLISVTLAPSFVSRDVENKGGGDKICWCFREWNIAEITLNLKNYLRPAKTRGRAAVRRVGQIYGYPMVPVIVFFGGSNYPGKTFTGFFWNCSNSPFFFLDPPVFFQYPGNSIFLLLGDFFPPEAEKFLRNFQSFPNYISFK